MKKKKEEKPSKKPKVHDELKGFELSVDQFGQIRSNVDIEKINAFLDRNVKDKKLAEQKGKKGKSNQKTEDGEE